MVGSDIIYRTNLMQNYMEGTRNERVIMVMAAYVIGFTTAFIAFGLNQMEESVHLVYVANTPATQSAAVAAATSFPADATSVSVYIDESGLVYEKGGVSRVISSYDVDASGEDGYHQSIFEFQVSSDGSTVYFCEIPNQMSDACKPFLYDSVEDVTYPLTIAGERIAVSLQPAELEWVDYQVTSLNGDLIDPVPSR